MYFEILQNMYRAYCKTVENPMTFSEWSAQLPEAEVKAYVKAHFNDTVYRALFGKEEK